MGYEVGDRHMHHIGWDWSTGRYFAVGRRRGGAGSPNRGYLHDREDKVCKQTDQLEQREPELSLTEGLDAEELEAQERKLTLAVFLRVIVSAHQLTQKMRK